MSSAVSSAAAAPSSGACATLNFSEFPTQNIACAAGGTTGVPDSYEGFFRGCCKSASVESWGDDCALYCLAVEQSVADLTACLQDAGVNAGQIFCNGNNTATATPSGSSQSTSLPTASTSGSGSSQSTSLPTASTSGSGSPSGTGSPSGASGTGAAETGAAGAVTVPHAVSKTGLGVVAMIAISVFAGAML